MGVRVIVSVLIALSPYRARQRRGNGSTAIRR
jgi:hypothetical protein